MSWLSLSAVHDSLLWMKQERDGPLWQNPIWLGKLSTYSHGFNFPHGRNHGLRNALLTLSLALSPCERGEVHKIRLFLLPSPVCQNLEIFLVVVLMVCYNFSNGLLEFHKGSLAHG